MQAGYQITQQRQPLAIGGHVDYLTRVTQDNNASKWWFEPRRAHLTQIQLEQDSGKSLYDPKQSVCLIDLNRAGIPPKQWKFQFCLSDFISIGDTFEKVNISYLCGSPGFTFLNFNIKLQFTGVRCPETINLKSPEC